jgi:hypothetical protein
VIEPQVAESGMDLRDLLSDPYFPLRKHKQRDFQQPFDALRRVTQAFAAHPENVLEELVQVAVDCCGADSAGISLEESDEAGEPTFRWVAVAGSFARYLNGRTPRFYSPCGTCLDTRRPQLYRLMQPYYDFLGVVADPITDGILIPWEAGEMRGTIWAVAHRSEEAFEPADYELLKSLSDFVAIILRHEAGEKAARRLERAEASSARAHEMAHQINNPLQSLTNTMYLARQGGPKAQAYVESAVEQLNRLSERVRKLLALRYDGA